MYVYKLFILCYTLFILYRQKAFGPLLPVREAIKQNAVPAGAAFSYIENLPETPAHFVKIITGKQKSMQTLELSVCRALQAWSG
jgi:hypothetical protein